MSLWDKIWGGKIWGKKKKEEEEKNKETSREEKKELSLKDSLSENYLFVPLFSEKAMKLIRENNAYTFLVDPKLNKSQIKNIVKKLFGVKVKKVRTINYPKRVRGSIVRIKTSRPKFKKAIVFLEKGKRIPLFE